MQKRQLLKKYFGHSEFRQLQEEVIDSILGGQDVVLVLPTGGGKSLCYQLPSLLLEGVTVVVSPLLALMHDQVVALRANGISAAMVSSMQSMQEIQEIEQQLFNNEIKLLYIAPERLQNSYFLNILKNININFFVIDEAHCVSEWGHEFREDYRKLSLLKEQFPNTTIAAFTATATKAVERDIARSLRLQSPKILRGKIFRENLTIKVRHRIKDGKAQLVEFLKGFSGQSGIVYTLSRKSTESIASFLQNKGIKAKPYHAGLSNDTKNSTYAQFIGDEIDVVVATIAFGMGIDKSNIRFVVHLSLPKTVENYYQEIGRAGRDGLESQTLLLYAASDIVQQKSFLEDLPQTPYKEHAFSKLDAMVKLANTQICRHRFIAEYFDDSIEDCKTKCDNCLEPQRNSVDITKNAQKLLSAIFRTGQSFGLHYVIDVLRGSKEKRVLQNGHDKLSVYGIGEDLSKSQWLSIGDRVLELGGVKVGDFKVHSLTNFGIEILKGKQGVTINEERLSFKKERQKLKQPVDTSDYNVEIFEKLRELRLQIAKKDGVPPYIVFSDKTLKELSIKQPASKEEMLFIHGIGEVKFEKYGQEFLELLCNDLSKEES